ncbi:hypothetical protein ACJ72_08664 [Emergomyces africanus]|uniref:Uncharacterized protein n=1 Tax=Emergomyces africanus TaxID=1955775 RepID=A0A1B7NJQ3_9EURO|nr:hypothetical protein ACJ72_08664 [Emergomyces africanus]
MKKTTKQEQQPFLKHLINIQGSSLWRKLATSEEYERFIDENENPLVIFTDFPQNELKRHEERFPGRLDYSHSLKILLLNHSFPSSRKTPEREKQADKSWAL